MNARVTVRESAIAVESDAEEIRADRRWSAFEWSGDISFFAAPCLLAYAFFFGGPWQAPVAAAAYWLAVEGVMHLLIWHLRREGDRLRERLAATEAEIAAREKVILARRAQILHLELLIKTSKMQAADNRAETERLDAEFREQLIQQGRLEERARLEVECATVRANQLEVMADQLDIRAEQLAARRDQLKVMRAVREIQDAVEDRIQRAYASGFIHGAQGATFAAPPGPHLTLVRSGT